MDNVALGKKGEHFVLRKLFDIGWTFPKQAELISFEGVDWAVEKENRIIKIQVKVMLSKATHMSNRNFDFLFVTDLVNVYIIPVVLLKRNASLFFRLTKRYKLLQNKFELLECKTELELCNALSDILKETVFP